MHRQDCNRERQTTQGIVGNRRLERFVAQVERVLTACTDEAAVLAAVTAAMRELAAVDDWLPPELAIAHPQYYRQYPLHVDAQQRFSVVSFVWGPGQSTPIHDHLVWGVIGMLRGSETAQGFVRGARGLVPDGPTQQLVPGDVAAVSPRIGDIHRVGNNFDGVSISIHAYGTDIGQQLRHVFDAVTGEAKPFRSGYSEPAVTDTQ
jgi:predicted metal-dependent enzyme (double-stranded beta helix superfamily)